MSAAPDSLDAMSADLGDFDVAVMGGGAASSSSPGAASILGPFGKWKDPPSRGRYFNTCTKNFLELPSAKQSKKEMIKILRQVANERGLFNFPPESAGERTSCSVYKALMEHLGSAVFTAESPQRKVLAALGGCDVDDKASVAASANVEKYTMDNCEELKDAWEELEGEIKTIEDAAAARKLELDDQVKSLRTAFKKHNEADEAKIEQIASKISELKKLYDKLDKQARAALKAAAGGGAAAAAAAAAPAAAAAGGKRKAGALVKDPIPTLESLIKSMDGTAAGKAALALLGSEEVNGAAALEAGKATKKPFTKDELFDELAHKHVSIVEEAFLISLIHHGLVKDE